jgi:hypothetical protein
MYESIFCLATKRSSKSSTKFPSYGLAFGVAFKQRPMISKISSFAYEPRREEA